MKRRSQTAGRRRRWASGALILVGGALALAFSVGLPGVGSPPSASGATEGGEPVPQADASVPAFNVTMIGASPNESSDETWGIGKADEGGSSAWTVVRYGDSGWSLGAALQNSSGQPLAEFVPDQAANGEKANPLAGQMTPSGSGVLVGHAPGANGREVMLTRDPGGAFRETASLPVAEEAPTAEAPEGKTEGKASEGETTEGKATKSEGVSDEAVETKATLAKDEQLFAKKTQPLIVPLDEPAGKAGAFVVPLKEAGGTQTSVLHWDGSAWTREPIEVPAPSSEEFKVVAVAASSPTNAWLLARLSSHYPSGSVALFRRAAGKAPEAASWKPVALTAGAGDEEAHPLTVDGHPFTVGEADPSQILTVTEQGVWIDGERADVHASTPMTATMFFKPEGADGGQTLAAWCKVPEGAPSGTEPCDHELPQSLPAGFSRSYAWANSPSSTPFGERVIAGLPEGVTLRLDGGSFTRVLALGGSEPPNDVGGTLGAAFTNPREGWLGQERLPVHLTLHPASSRLSPWPVPFHHTLVAIAPQPEAPVGALSSQALAVGDEGEVARYEPGEGWTPESLLGPGGRFETPRLRAVAWPRPTRAYAVGDKGEMWLWRGETGLWEPDPATPYNFDGNLTGIAFDPGNPQRGYAVGQGGVLLGYGKTWHQEALPSQVANANFTSVAFAGSEAIAAYHELPNPSENAYIGGLLVNEGSGWHVDTQAASAMGSNVPWAVAGLPDGGAAFAAGESSGSGAGGAVFERSGVGAAWQQSATPLPGGSEPGSLALFREGGALRVIASGSVPNTYSQESEPSPPPGVPPILQVPYPLSAEYGAGHVIRQTATGWSDEEHELNNIHEPPGSYKFYDTVYQPDPISAVLVDPTGSQGWAVGGFSVTEGSARLDTASVDRYPADGSTPSGVGTAPISSDPSQATFAIGGGAQCAAPCADRANARIGPDVWLSSALSRAAQISNVRAFLYTGPRVSTGETSGEPPPFPYAKELTRYAKVLSGPLPVFTAASPSDLDSRPFAQGSEGTFEEAFASFPQPLGNAAATSSLVGVGHSPETCPTTPGCQVAYYALESTGAAGTVRVIMLDNTGDVDSTQLAWLAGELATAKGLSQPAIVVGNADLNAQILAHDQRAEEVAQTLIDDGASAYFFDSPQENVSEPLRVGGSSIPSFGSGTLGYVSAVQEQAGDFHGASGFMLGQVDIAARNPATNQAPVTARLIPNIGELAMEAKAGTLLRRSQVAEFAALARRPRSGNRSQNQSNTPETDPYIPIPSDCIGSACASSLFPEYSFSSSRPDIGDFVQPNLNSPEPRAVLLGPEEKPIHDAASGLFCAYNAGTTVVTISAGGLSSSLTVTVQAGSVRRPCGTVPLKEQAASQQQSVAAPPPPAPAPAPTGAAPQTAPAPAPVPVPPAPLITAPAPVHATPAPPAPTPPFVLPAATPAPVLPFVPLPVPSPARPTPPTGTSAVTSPVEAPEREEEEEEATESVGNKAVAYRATDHEVQPAYILGLLVLAAFAGAAVRRRPRRRGVGEDLMVAPATLTTIHSQRRMQEKHRGGHF